MLYRLITGQIIPPQAKIYPHDINHYINSDERYGHDLFNFQQVTDESVLSGKLSEKAKLTELKSVNSKAGHTIRLPWLKPKPKY